MASVAIRATVDLLLISAAVAQMLAVLGLFQDHETFRMKTCIGETFAVIGKSWSIRHSRAFLLCRSALVLRSINLVLVGVRDQGIHMNCSGVRGFGILKNHVILWNCGGLENFGILWRDVIPRGCVIHKGCIGLRVGVHRSQLSKGCKTNFVLICRFQTIVQNKHGMRGFLRRS